MCWLCRCFRNDIIVWLALAKSDTYFRPIWISSTLYYFHAQMRCMICFGQLNLYLCIIFDLVVRFFALSLSLALSLFLNTILAPVFRFQNIRQNGIDFVRIELSENHPKEIPKKLI